jgi:hypothetical protein
LDAELLAPPLIVVAGANTHFSGTRTGGCKTFSINLGILSQRDRRPRSFHHLKA